MEGGDNVAAVANTEIPGGKGQLVGHEEIVQQLPAPSSKVDEGGVVLAKSVSHGLVAPQEGLPAVPEAEVHAAERHNEPNGVQGNVAPVAAPRLP